MWIDTDRKAKEKPSEPWIEASEFIFWALYTAEFCLRVFVDRTKVFRDRWNRLDFMIILIDLVSTIGKLTVGSALFGNLNMSLFRLARVFRIARVFKVLRPVIELQLLIQGFYGALRAVLFAVVMLEVVILLWCFVLVEAVHPIAVDKQLEGSITAYSSMWNAHLSIIQQVVAGDGWAAANVPIIEERPEMLLIFFGILVTIQFMMLNLMLTVIVDSAHRARADDDKQLVAAKEHRYAKMKQNLMEMVKEFDKDGSGELSVEELMAGFQENEVFADLLHAMDVGLDDMQSLFWIMDEDRSGQVSAAEFVNNIWKLKEQDINTTLMFIKAYLIDLRVKVRTDLHSMIAENLKIAHATRNSVQTLGTKAKADRSRSAINIADLLTEPKINLYMTTAETALSQDAEHAEDAIVFKDPEDPEPSAVQIPTKTPLVGP